MRVIAGTAKGLRLKSPRGSKVRPTSDRVKEALFNIIGARIVESLFLDLFAGSGAVGIEALSRGASSAIFVDHKRENLNLIRENLTRARLTHNARLIQSSTDRAVKMLAGEYIQANIIFLDPPYSISNPTPCIENIKFRKIIKPNGLIIIEHAYINRLWANSYPNLRQEKYGDTALTFISPI